VRFLIISHVKHKKQDAAYFAYEPYVREMNIWLKYVDQLEIVAPLNDDRITEIDSQYQHSSVEFTKIPEIQFTTIGYAIRSLFFIPTIFLSIYKACKRADHIHLRCPGNIGLIACFVQVFFPKKTKTAKYAGNWDPNSKQPLSYRLQKSILSNTFWTKNIQVLVYGDYGSKSINIKPFFTASFKDSDIESITERDYTKSLKFLFVGSLVDGKRPLLTLKIVENLILQNIDVSIDFYGDGSKLASLEEYVTTKNLEQSVKFHGNRSRDTIKSALKEAHFLLLPSKSEGWPKAVAEAMFFGTIPIATKISCVPFMLDKGKRGILIEPDIEMAIKTILSNLEPVHLSELRRNAVTWSQKYTLEEFENNIKQLLST